MNSNAQIINILKILSNRLGVLRRVINSNLQENKVRAEDLSRRALRNYYKPYTIDPYTIQVTEILNHDLKLIHYFFSECLLEGGKYNQIKFEDEVRKRICGEGVRSEDMLDIPNFLRKSSD